MGGGLSGDSMTFWNDGGGVYIILWGDRGLDSNNPSVIMATFNQGKYHPWLPLLLVFDVPRHIPRDPRRHAGVMMPPVVNVGHRSYAIVVRILREESGDNKLTRRHWEDGPNNSEALERWTQ